MGAFLHTTKPAANSKGCAFSVHSQVSLFELGSEVGGRRMNKRGKTH